MNKKFDHGELTDEERAAKGLETEAEAAARVEQQAKEPKVQKKAKTTKTKTKTAKPKAAKMAKPKAAKTAAAKKAPAARTYVFHKGTKTDPKTPNAQCAPRQDTTVEDLNDKEKKVLSVVKRNPGIGYPDLVEKADLGPKGKRASWTRNALRRLVRDGFVTKPEAGVYKPGRRAA